MPWRSVEGSVVCAVEGFATDDATACHGMSRKRTMIDNIPESNADICNHSAWGDKAAFTVSPLEGLELQVHRTDVTCT